MPRLPSSRSNRRRHPRPQFQPPRHRWLLRRAYVLVRRRHSRSSRRLSQARGGRLPRYQPTPRPVADASQLENGLNEQEPGARESPIVIPSEEETAVAANNEPRRARAWFITMQQIGQTGYCDCQVEWVSVEASACRLLDTQSEDSLIWDSMTRSVSFAIVDGHPIEAIERVHNRFIGRFGGARVVDYDL